MFLSFFESFYFRTNNTKNLNQWPKGKPVLAWKFILTYARKKRNKI